MTGEAGNASRRKVMVEATARRPMGQGVADAGRIAANFSRVRRMNFGDRMAKIFHEHSDSPLAVAFKILFNKNQVIRKDAIILITFKRWAVGFCIGIISGLLGIGGGAIAVPIFLRLGLSTHHAIATSSACVLLLAVVGALTFTLTGLHAQNLPAGSGGFVYWPAVIAISIGSMLVVPLGTRLGKCLPGHHLRKIFAVFLLVIGITLLIP